MGLEILYDYFGISQYVSNTVSALPGGFLNGLKYLHGTAKSACLQ